MTHSLELTPAFLDALREIAEGESHLFVTGKAGTGKSTLLRYYCSHIARAPIVLAPTGIAALNVKGQTIHRFFKFRHDINLQKIAHIRLRSAERNLYRNLREIIIDEISMVRADLLDCVDAFLRRFGPFPEWPFGGVRLIMFGDVYQLPPVVTERDRDLIYRDYRTPYFFSARALQGESLAVIELDKIFRQSDPLFIALLNDIRVNKIGDESLALLKRLQKPLALLPDDDQRIVITATNARAQRINSAYLAKIDAPAFESEAEVAGEFKTSDYPTDKRLIIKKGARIIMLYNDRERRWVNGSMATISEIAYDEDDEELVVYARIDESGEIARIHQHTWSNFHYVAAGDEYDTVETGSFTQFPFRLAWAITVHKSQGKSFSKVHIDLGARAFAAGQTYVALSRARSLTHLSLERHLTRSDIYVDEALIGFFAKITESGTINSDHARRKDPREIRTELADAIEKAHVMRIEYIHRNGHIGYRTIRGEGIAQKIYQREPYSALEGYCLETHKKCVFNIKNILDLSILDRS